MKKILRKELLYLRDNIEDRYDKSMIIKDKIMDLDIYKNSNCIALYNSIKSEVDTRDLIKESLLNGKIILLPRIINKNKMVFIVINSETKYERNNFGLLEPIGIESNNIDLIICPGVAFDKDLNRLGYGMGYYDKYLKDKDIYKIGICYKEQLVDKIETDVHDIKMDMVITD
jgi:5-formyltetrahydrofolate cyclo-ligase